MAHKTGKEVAEILSNFVNGASEKDLTEFVDYMTHNVHRTLQQGTMKLIGKQIAAWASLGEYQYDLRNEATVKLCKKLMEKFDKYDWALPLI